MKKRIDDLLADGEIKPLSTFYSRVNRHGILEVYVPVKKINNPPLIELLERNYCAIGWEKDVYIKKNGAFDKMMEGKVDKTENGFVIYHRHYIYLKT